MTSSAYRARVMAPATSIDSDQLVHRIHASLYRPITYAGATPELVITEAAIIIALVFVVGLHLTTLALAVFFATVVHSMAVWITARDPQMIPIYLRSLRFRDFYAPHASPHACGGRVFPAIPSHS